MMELSPVSLLHTQAVDSSRNRVVYLLPNLATTIKKQAVLTKILKNRNTNLPLFNRIWPRNTSKADSLVGHFVTAFEFSKYRN